MSQRERKTTNNTPVKIIMVVVLVAVLIVVCLSQFGMLSSPGPADDSTTSESVSKRPKLPKLNVKKSTSPKPVTTKGKLTDSIPKQEPVAAVTETEPVEAWPETAIEDLKHDPFGNPSELARLEQSLLERERAEKLAAELEEKRAAVKAERDRILKMVSRLSQNGVELTYIQNDRRVAKVDGKLVREGDIIEGLRIVEIKENGRLVVEATNWPSDPSSE